MFNVIVSVNLNLTDTLTDTGSYMDNPLNLDSSWRCLNVQGRDPRAMIQQGPNIGVTIAAIAAGGTRLADHVCGAIIDTGAEASCVSPDMFAKLTGGVHGVRDIAHVYGNVIGERTVGAEVIGVLRIFAL